MNIISFLASADAPSGLWSILINWFHSGIGNFGWTILIVTILVKLIVSPLDFMVKLNSKKQTLVQQKCAPQIAKIQKKFGKDAVKVREQTNSLYKREGLNMRNGCIITLVNMIISLTIFFSFFGSLRTNSAYQAITQYEQLHAVYVDKSQEYLISKNADILEYDITDKASADIFIADYNKAIKINEIVKEIKAIETEIAASTSQEEITAKEAKIKEKEDAISKLLTEEDTLNNKDRAYFEKLFSDYSAIINDTSDYSADAVVAKWNETKSSWLWVANIWVADAVVYPFQTYDNLVSIAKEGGYTEYVTANVDKTEYEIISSIVNLQGGRSKNGYFILAILAALVTFASQYIMEKTTNRLRNKNAQQLANASMSGSMEMSMKVMKFIMPVMMVIFVLQSSASFGIYILASNIITIVIGQISNIFINKITRAQQEEVEASLEKQAKKLIKQGKLQEKK